MAADGSGRLLSAGMGATGNDGARHGASTLGRDAGDRQHRDAVGAKAVRVPRPGSLLHRRRSRPPRGSRGAAIIVSMTPSSLLSYLQIAMVAGLVEGDQDMVRCAPSRRECRSSDLTYSTARQKTADAAAATQNPSATIRYGQERRGFDRLEDGFAAPGIDQPGSSV